MQGRIYTVPFDNVAVTTTADLFDLDPAVDKPIRILSIDVGQTNRTGDANEDMVRWSIRRFTGATITVGSGGTAPTPTPVNVGDGAAAFTARVTDTTIATTTGTNTLVHASTFNTRVGLLWVPPPECLVLAADTTGNCKLIVRLEEAPSASTTFSGTCYVEELG
jgi:hypothetical protein